MLEPGLQEAAVVPVVLGWALGNGSQGGHRRLAPAAAVPETARQFVHSRQKSAYHTEIAVKFVYLPCPDGTGQPDRPCGIRCPRAFSRPLQRDRGQGRRCCVMERAFEAQIYRGRDCLFYCQQYRASGRQRNL
jgi:hypothetical protein